MNPHVLVENKAVYVNNAVPDDLCNQTINHIEKEYVFQKCKINNKHDADFRTSSEVKISDPRLTNKFWKHICNYVPTIFDNSQLIGPDHKRVYLLKYVKGQFFKKHYDGFSEDSNGNRSKLTVLIYLNTLKDGGETRFYAEPNRNVHLPGFQETIDVKPEIGKLLIFEHRLLHEGMPLTDGFKYCIRFNILYSKYQSLKYTTAKMNFDGKEILLTPDRNNKDAKARWNDVCMRPHVFYIKPRFPGFVDTSMGRPPTREEDYCPNCYEILSLRNNYKECPSCKSPVEAIIEELRKINM